MGLIKENMKWPPESDSLLSTKMKEYSAWYSGDSEILANFYTDYLAKNAYNLPRQTRKEPFWGRQIKNQGEIFVHVPVAGDIAETSSNLLFGESPSIKIAQAHEERAQAHYKESQKELDAMLMDSRFFSKIIEGAESCAALGGVFIKIAWDSDLSPYPIPVVVQADKAIPEFKFGILTAVTFWKVIDADESGRKVYRLLERYEKGSISYSLYLGTVDRLGHQVSLTSHPDTKGLSDVTTVDELLAVYIPNMLPNRLDRTSFLGRSDYAGIIGMMDSLDQIYTSWVKDVALAQARLLLPESFVNGDKTFNVDEMLFVKLDIDPTNVKDSTITPQQFAIRSQEFEMASLNFLERIVTSAGYSPQSFGLNIEGRAESGTALTIRERKSFATKAKKENYWQAPLKKLVRCMILVYSRELGGKIAEDSEINVAFNDGISNSIHELSTSVKMISDAMASSIDTRVRILHPDWDEDQIKVEVARIKEENMVGMPNPEGNYDLTEMDYNDGEDEDEGDE